jgi:hypothetical protein
MYAEPLFADEIRRQRPSEAERILNCLSSVRRVVEAYKENSDLVNDEDFRFYAEFTITEASLLGFVIPSFPEYAEEFECLYRTIKPALGIEL